MSAIANIPHVGGTTNAIDVTQYSGLVNKIAWQVLQGKPLTVSYADLVGYGWIGLLEAAQRFDPTRGLAFTTFAWSRVRGAMLDGISKMHHSDWQTSHIEDLPAADVSDDNAAQREMSDAIAGRQFTRRLNQRDLELTTLFANAPTLSELVPVMGLSKARVSRIRIELVDRLRRIAA